MKTLKNDVNDARENATKHFDYEPKLSHRWIVEIQEMDIKPYFIQSITAPTIIRKRNNWGYSKPHIEPVDITFMEAVNTNHYGSFIDKMRNNEKLTIKLKYLDPLGKQTGILLMENSMVIEIWQDKLSYEHDGLIKTNVKFKPTSVKFSL